MMRAHRFLVPAVAAIVLVPGIAFGQDEVQKREEKRAAAPVTADQEQARKRDAEAAEDPLQRRQAEKVDRPLDWSDKPSGYDLYGSLRLRYRRAGGETVLGDGGSRIGVNATWQYRPQSWILGRVEAGFNLLDALDAIFDPGSRPDDGSDALLFPRLYYVGVETPTQIATVGKNWSTYYQVTGFTDWFDSTGGSASGTYNAQTDGGPTGTGRADAVLQTRVTVDWLQNVLHVKPFDMNVQVQYGRDIPHVADRKYGLTLGLSGIFKTRDDTEVGLAYNRAHVQEHNDPALLAKGIHGDAQALAFGARQIRDRWYLATTVTRLVNHETTDQQRYFDGWGWEVYGRYRLFGKLWGVAGLNWLEPDRGQPLAGRYRLKYGVLGLRYSIKGFQRLVFLEARFDRSREFDGTQIGDSATIGVRWDFD